MKKINFTILVLSLCFLFGISQLHAQTADKPWSIGLTGGKTAYNGDLGNGFFNFDQPFHGQMGLKFARYLNPSFNVSLDGSYGRFGHCVDLDNGQNFLADMLHANVTADYKLNNGYILQEDAVIQPWIFAGLGLTSLSAVDNRGVDGVDFTIPLGLGANVRLTEALGLFYQATYGLNFGDDKDGFTTTSGNDNFLLNQIGIKYNLGAKAPDADGDGISDKKDGCPDVPGLAELAGCPDSDGDGIADRSDSCPNQAGLAEYKGCPDTDGDGIQDKIDRCPDVAGPAEMGGCPDSDGDGMADNVDKCPTVPGAKASSGCPDTDGDGIADNADKCPSVKGVSANGGCPQVSSTTLAVFERALTGIQFETASDVIKGSSYSILDQVVSIMQENPSYLLSIEGHTDSQGDDASNLDLSQRRAASVKSYLVNKGVTTNRMSTNGYGETQPIADNSTPEGRALNRRVAFKVSF